VLSVRGSRVETICCFSVVDQLSTHRGSFVKKTAISIVVVAVAIVLIVGGVQGWLFPSEEAESIMVYSGAGMRKPMDEIGQVFHNYAGSNALLSQMELTELGDAYMPGETMYIEIAREKGLTGYQQLVCYHIPVITVPNRAISPVWRTWPGPG